MGFETVKKLAAKGANVILACRTLSKGYQAKEAIAKDISFPVHIDVMELDLASFASIEHFAKSFSEKYGKLDILVNNAGIMAIPQRETTKDRLEMQIGTNHFGHFLLTSLLFPLISNNGRIINHSSGAHLLAALRYPYENLLSENSYNPWVQYGNSKASNLLFTYELNRRLSLIGNPKNIQCIAVHPGYSATNLQTGRYPMSDMANALFAMKAEHGAQSQLLAAAGEDVASYGMKDTFIGPKYLAFGAPRVQSILRTYDNAAQEYLWNESVRLTGSNFGGVLDFSVNA